MMIRKLVDSAFQTRCLSVASEGLLRQVMGFNSYHSGDLDAIASLCDAVNSGYIQREAQRQGEMRLVSRY